MSQAFNLVARVTVTLAWVYQLRGEFSQAIRLIEVALTHTATEDEARTKGKCWLQDMGTDVNAGSPEKTREEMVTEIIQGKANAQRQRDNNG
jgi:hypothetical protein